MNDCRTLFRVTKSNGRIALGWCFVFLICWLIPTFIISVCPAAPAIPRQATEYQIKAAYIYNFLLFVQWPEPNIPPTEARPQKPSSPDRRQTITIGIIGKDPFGNAFKDVEGKLIRYKKKKLIIKRYGHYQKNLNFDHCQVLFICSSERKNLRTILTQVKGKPILTIAETPGFLELGGMFRLLEKRKKIHWEINQTPVKLAKLKLNSQLLRNAVRVVQIPKLPVKRKPKSSSDAKKIPEKNFTRRTVAEIRMVK